ncbi:proteolipid protein 2-like isoform X2 [Hypanus sabinus]|uniref:proteolipid protein 2-like isoform X2 n=1 Tax=Hypanus sabinus TaxID=79690 RepID=UPI0028C467A0|nr:proteolipid protein 2-like isoform X2 [Hypanus sabinus]
MDTERVFSLGLAIFFLASPQGAYVVCAVIELVFAGTFYWVYLNRYDQTIISFNWAWTDVFRCTGAAIIYLVISISYGMSGNAAGLILSLVAMFIFTHNLYLLRPVFCPESPEAAKPPVDNP